MVHMRSECLTVGELCRGLPRMVLNPSHTVLQAVEMMDHYNRYAVGVESNGQFAGLFSYNDYLSEVLLKMRHPGTTLLEDVMALEPLMLDPDDAVIDAQETCHLNGVRYFPVIEDNRILAIMSVSDLAGGREQYYKHADHELLQPRHISTTSTQRFAVFPV